MEMSPRYFIEIDAKYNGFSGKELFRSAHTGLETQKGTNIRCNLKSPYNNKGFVMRKYNVCRKVREECLL